MGKSKKHNKLYITRSEWENEFGGKRAGDDVGERGRQALPFFCCSLSLLPFEHPVCTPDGTVFDLLHIIPFLKKYKVDPTTGEPLSPKQLIKLHFHKNENDEYHCPLTHKLLTVNSHVVAIRTTGHVYPYSTISELCLRTNNLVDPLENTPFKRDDILTIQDPKNKTRGWGDFYHVRKDLKVEKAALDELAEKQRKKKKKEEREQAEASAASAAASASASTAVSSTYASASFTCAGYQQKPEVVPVWASPGLTTTRKAYVRLVTSLGDINLELRTDLVPKTCENFLILCQRGYYDGVLFHRLIKNFMIQGGDPTGTGRGGESAWGHAFLDEFKSCLKHDGRGVLSMANSGPNTNNSQFFITFKSCSHLDGKHSVFGKVVGGMDVLGLMEKMAVDEDDRPLEEISIVRTVIFVNPFETLEEERAELQEKERRKEMEANPELGQWYSNPRGEVATSGGAGAGVVGRYLPAGGEVGAKRKSTFGEVKEAKRAKKKADPFSRW
eukprot:TRINITY_DN2524_c1_g1_i2.p1 TRINITY_DN2524_c1_g1~~TRINITY_DN2524_c1_g1_i2.p1  ORF type:complete len:499 (-),score=170.62 TRINITY_DN2524_c1_g1_i2:115-1611(-)